MLYTFIKICFDNCLKFSDILLVVRVLLNFTNPQRNVRLLAGRMDFYYKHVQKPLILL